MDPINNRLRTANVESPSGDGELAGFGYSVRTTFGRRNPPWEAEWKVGGEHVSYYRLDRNTASYWLEQFVSVSEPESMDGVPPT